MNIQHFKDFLYEEITKLNESLDYDLKKLNI